MINNVIIVGRLCADPTLHTLDEGISVCNLSLAVTRPFKDMTTGEYGTDFINVSLWYGISKIAYTYTSKGDVVGIKGRLSSRTKEINGTKITSLELIGEKISFISSSKHKDDYKAIDDNDEFDQEIDINDDFIEEE